MSLRSKKEIKEKIKFLKMEHYDFLEAANTPGIDLGEKLILQTAQRIIEKQIESLQWVLNN